MNDKIYVKRGENGQIIAISKVKLDDFTEQLDCFHPDVIEFLGDESFSSHAEKTFQESDIQLIRVLEDLIEILIDKNIIRLTELPEAAQNKLLSRKKIRDAVSDILSEETNFDDGSNVDV